MPRGIRPLFIEIPRMDDLDCSGRSALLWDHILSDYFLLGWIKIFRN